LRRFRLGDLITLSPGMHIMGLCKPKAPAPAVHIGAQGEQEDSHGEGD